MTRLHLSIPDPDPGDLLPASADDAAAAHELHMAATMAIASYDHADEARVHHIVCSAAPPATSADIMVAAAVLVSEQVHLMAGGPRGDWPDRKAQRVALLAIGKLARCVSLGQRPAGARPAAADIH